MRALLRLAAYQILYLDRIPDHAAVNEAVEMAERMSPRAKGFVNGVLRNLARQKELLFLPEGGQPDKLSLRFSIAQPLVEMLMQQYPDLYRDILPGLDTRAPLSLFVNAAISSSDLT